MSSKLYGLLSFNSHTTTIRHLTQPLGSDLADLEEASRQLAAVGDKAQVVLAMALTAL